MTRKPEIAFEGRGERRFPRTRSPAAKMAAKARAQRRQGERAGASGLRVARGPSRLDDLHIGEVVRAVLQAIDAEARKAQSKATAPEGDMFSPGPRARALLRGKDIAARDLAESGGCYTLEEARSLLNSVSRQSIEKRVREGRLIAVVGQNNKRYYPVAQFNDDGSVVEGLRAVQDALATRNGYAVLNFLVTPDARLDDRKPIELLRRGEVARVVEAAARLGELGA